MEDPAQIDVVGSTPLLLAAASGDIESMKLLLDHGADKDAKTIGGATLFMLAAGAGAEEDARDEQEAIAAAKFVLSLGKINVNAELTANDAKNGPGAGKIDGRNIMHFAVTLAWKDMIRFLDEQGVDLDHGDRYGMTPLMIAMGDPEARYYRNIPVGRYDDRYRRPRASKDIEDLLLEVGAAPFTGKIVNKGSVD
jgi:ankyrin repeat protein